MNRSLQAIFEKGMLRSLEPLALQEHEQVTVTVSDKPLVEDWEDTAFLTHLETQADDSVTVEHVRAALAKIGGSMVEDFLNERDERI